MLILTSFVFNWLSEDGIFYVAHVRELCNYCFSTSVSFDIIIFKSERVYASASFKSDRKRLAPIHLQTLCKQMENTFDSILPKNISDLC